MRGKFGELGGVSSLAKRVPSSLVLDTELTPGLQAVSTCVERQLPRKAIRVLHLLILTHCFIFLETWQGIVTVGDIVMGVLRSLNLNAVAFLQEPNS